MNQQQAGEILRANVAYLQEPLKSAVEFTLEKFYPPPSAAELAKNFLASLSSMTTEDAELQAKIDAAYFALMNTPEIWYDLNNLPHEIWREIVGYENLYQVSNYGRVKSFKCNKQKILKARLYRRDYRHGDKYLAVELFTHGKAKSIKIHRLVAKAFIPNPYNKPEVNHRFGNKQDNRAENLEWVTQLENVRHAHRIGLIKMKSGCKHQNAKFTEEQIRYIRETCILGDLEFGISALARKFGVNIATISEMYHGKTYKKVT